MQTNSNSVVQRSSNVLTTNRIIRNTYLLLAMAFVFGTVAAVVSTIINPPAIAIIPFIILYIALVFMTQALRNSPWGIVCVFAATGSLGFLLGPILNSYLHTYINGGQLITMALGATAVIFFGLTIYAFTTKKDFSYLGGFLMVAILVAVLAVLASFLIQTTVLNILISGLFTLIAGGYILYQTSDIIHNENANYITAALLLYVSIFQLFINLLQIFGAFGGRR